MCTTKTMGSVVLCLVVALTATPASARQRHHGRHHHPAVRYFSELQPPMMAAAPDFGPMQQRRRTRVVAGSAALNAPPLSSSYPSMMVSGPVIERPVRRQQRQPVQMASNDPGSYGAGMSFGGTSLVAEAQRWIGGNPTGRSSLWCGNFMNFVLNRTGHQTSPSNTARSFASYGHRLPGPQVGAIAVMSRGHGGHVGVVSGIDPSGNPIIISGNHGHRVGESVYPRGRIYAYVSP